MQIKTQPASYSTRVALVTLENEREQALTDDELLRLTDNLRGVKYNHESASYELDGSGFGPDRYFGGTVEVVSEQPLTKRVTVYID